MMNAKTFITVFTCFILLFSANLLSEANQVNKEFKVCEKVRVEAVSGDFIIIGSKKGMISVQLNRVRIFTV